MTIKECETRIEDINQRFREYFHIDFDVDVFLLGKASVETKRAALFYYHCNFTKAKEIRNHRLQAIISDFSCLSSFHQKENIENNDFRGTFQAPFLCIFILT